MTNYHRPMGKQTLIFGAAVAISALLAGGTAAATTTVPPDGAVTTTTAVPIAPIATFTGSGSDVVDLGTISGPHVLDIGYQGGGNFVVWSLDSDFQQIDLMVNTIGNYLGKRMLNLFDDEHAQYLEIDAEAGWTVNVMPFPEAANLWTGGEYHGVGDDVIIFLGDPGIVEWATAGDSNFVVLVFGTDSGRDLMVNEIGPLDGTGVLRDGQAIILVDNEGDFWLNLR